ncbi:glycosyltransferase family protein [Engelhardtia mirabilis]|uniref:MurG-like transferase n=1 Tax=Engelhardtia mirabilis TaxID=2528011 RepID=A0A518BDN2_9BACT|nr:MurG-like transferase [Planctomycetes bacterium Pla133]QDU99410.1 MurG-like transferase [Planctomycetes bacterium Pla86]
MKLADHPPHALRFLLYSHDSFGLGHLRRSLNLARRLTASFPGASAVVATGSPCATHFVLPPRVEVVKLPSVGKAEGGAYAPRFLPGSMERVSSVRRALLTSLWESWQPHCLIVDHQVTGLCDEILGLLQRAAADGVRTILGVRDVIDAPDRVAQEWGRESIRWALSEAYDRVCVYGSPEVFDVREAYPFPPELGRRLEYVGYVVRQEARPCPEPIPDLEPEVLLTTGGGEDGECRILAYLEALRLSPADWRSTIVLGPMLAPEAERRVRIAAHGLRGIEVHRFCEDLPRRMSRADAVVAMAGYNTVAELLSSGRPTVLMPRRQPRLEQQVRADALERLGLVTQADERRPAEVRAAIERALSRGVRPDPISRPRLDGLDGMVEVASELLEREPQLAGAIR